MDSDNLQLVQNPYIAGQNCVFENARKLIALGHKPTGVCFNYHFADDLGEVVDRFNKFRDGVVFASKKLKIKISDVSFSNSDKTGFSLIMIGKKKKHNKIFVPYFENGQMVYIIGKPDNLPATSSYQEILNGQTYPYPDEVNSKFEKRLTKCIKKLQKKDIISGVIAVNRFGIIKALVNALIPEKLGFKAKAADFNLNFFFNEIQSRYLVSTNENIEPILKKHKIPYILLGKTNSDDYIELENLKLDCNSIFP